MKLFHFISAVKVLLLTFNNNSSYRKSSNNEKFIEVCTKNPHYVYSTAPLTNICKRANYYTKCVIVYMYILDNCVKCMGI